jgi:hypothetical protein
VPLYPAKINKVLPRVHDAGSAQRGSQRPSPVSISNRPVLRPRCRFAREGELFSAEGLGWTGSVNVDFFVFAHEQKLEEPSIITATGNPDSRLGLLATRSLLPSRRSWRCTRSHAAPVFMIKETFDPHDSREPPRFSTAISVCGIGASTIGRL